MCLKRFMPLYFLLKGAACGAQLDNLVGGLSLTIGWIPLGREGFVQVVVGFPPVVLVPQPIHLEPSDEKVTPLPQIRWHSPPLIMTASQQEQGLGVIL